MKDNLKVKRNIVGIYFSGTGNTKHSICEFVKNLDESASVVSIEEVAAIELIKRNDFIVFAYPIYFSNLPKIVKDFIYEHRDIWKGKQIFSISTMGLFSGDGAGCSARLFKKYGANVVGGLHLKMPDSISDEKVLKRSLEQNRNLIKAADEKIKVTTKGILDGRPTREGLNFFYHIGGLFGQRLWFLSKTKTYCDKLKIDREKCIGCGTCIELCPLNNISLVVEKAEQNNKCTMCYRCISNCPKKAITLLGKEVVEQCKYEKYV